MPRSGTSLVEQIISSHSKVYGSGELDFLETLVSKNFYKKNIFDAKILETEDSQNIVDNISAEY